MSNLSTLINVTNDDLAALAAAGIIPSDCPPAQVAIFAQLCGAVQLDPRLKEIELIPLGGGKYSPYVRKDGLRKIAARTGDFAGIEPIRFDVLPNGSYKTAAQFDAGQKPRTATCTVYRFVRGEKCAFTVTVSMSEFNKGRGQWQAMPIQMLSKVAEAHALRMAFPEATNGLLSEGELEVARDIAAPARGPVLPALEIGSPKFQQVVVALATDKATLEQVWTKFQKDDAVQDALIDAVNEYQSHTP